VTTLPDPLEDCPCPSCGSEPARAVVVAGDRLDPHDRALYTVVRCLFCGLAYTRPRPSPLAIAGFYPPSYSGGGRAGLLEQIESRYREHQQREAARWLSEGRPQRGRLLDVGCGRGDLLQVLRNDGWQAFGVEPAQQGAAAARARGIQVRCTRFEELSEDDRYDVVVFSGVLEHLHDPLGALRKALRVLSPGGLVAVLYVPLLDSPQARALRERWVALDLPRHLVHFESATFPRFAERAGLRVTHRRDYSRRHNASQLVSSLLPSLQKHRLYQEEARSQAGRYLHLGLGPVGKRITYALALTAARPLSRVEAALGFTPMRSYFLEPAPRAAIRPDGAP